MKLSQAARYGLKAMSDLCECLERTKNPVSVSEIASRQKIPVNYLEQLFGKLKRASLLESVRGAQGGYLLAKPAEEISIADILNALGEPFIFGSCQTKKGCENAVTCPTFNLWRRVKGSVDEILEATTLKDIAAEKNSLLENLEKFIDPEREKVKNLAINKEA